MKKLLIIMTILMLLIPISNANARSARQIWNLIFREADGTLSTKNKSEEQYLNLIYDEDAQALAVYIDSLGTLKVDSLYVYGHATFDSTVVINDSLYVGGNVRIDGVVYTDEFEDVSGAGITLNSDLKFDKIETLPDAGFINVINHPLSTSSTKEGGSFSVRSNNILSYYGTGDSAGGITSPTVEITGDLTVSGTVSFTSALKAEMGNYGSDSTELLRSSDEWHGVFNANIGVGDIEGFTYLDGEEFGITDVSNDGTYVTFVTSAQTLVAGQPICIQETTDMDGIWIIYDVADVTHFRVTSAIAASEAAITAYGQRGASVRVDSGSTGDYRGIWHATVKQSGVNKYIEFNPFLNATQAIKAWDKREFSDSSDVGSVGGVALMTLTAGDYIWFGVMGDTTALTITFEGRNMTIE